MVTLLSRIFIKDYNDTNNEKVRSRYGILSSIVGILLNIILFGFKYFAGVLSGSIAITADAFNNLSDAGSSIITLVGFKFSGMKPDITHPFGHGRIEYVSGLAVSVAIIVMGFELAKSSVTKIFNPSKIDTSIIAMVILIASICVKLYMYIYNTSISKKIKSATVKATALDSISDSIATFVVLLSIIVMKFTGINIDGISGVLVALFILYAGYSACKETLNPLLGKAPEKEFVDEIRKIVLDHEIVKGVHDLIVHDYGPGRVFISVHAEVNGDEDIFVIHDSIDCIERELNEKLHCESVIHMDPIESNNEKVVFMRDKVAKEIKKLNDKITIHDFRMVEGPTHTNLIFDAVVPFDIKENEEEVKGEIEEVINKNFENCNAVVTIDNSYI